MKRRNWKKFGIIIGILAIILLVIIVVLPMLLDLNRYNGIIVSEIQKAVGGMVSLGHISWGISNGIWLEADGFSIVDATAFPADLKFSRFYAKVSILPLLDKKIVLKKLVLDGSDVKIRLEPDKNKEPAPTTHEAVTQARDASQPGAPFAKKSGTNVSDTIADDSTAVDFQLPLAIEIEQLAVAIGRLELNDALTLPDQAQVRVFTDVDLAATNLVPGKEMAFTIALRDKNASGLGELKAQGTFVGLTESLTLENPKLTVKLEISALHSDAIKPYLRNSPLAQRLDGNVSLVLNYQGDLSSRHRVEGDIDLSLITYSEPSLWDAALPGAKTTVTYLVRFNPDELMVEKLTLKLGKLSLKTSGDVHNWRKNPVIKNAILSADLPLPELIPLMPWKRLGQNAAIFRPILENGGKIVIEQVVLPEIKLADHQANLEAMLTQVDMTAQLSGISVQPSPNIPKVEEISGRLNLNKGVLAATDMRARVGPLSLPDLNIRVTNIVKHPVVDLRAKGPLEVAATHDANVEKLLHRYGLKSLTGSVIVDMNGYFDQRKSKSWVANGSLMIKGIRAESYPAAVVMDDLKGEVKFNRKKTMDITAEGITARINQAPVRLSGKLTGIGTPNMLVAAKAYAKQLDLAHLAELLPALKDLKIGGMLDMNLDVHLPYAVPEKSWLKGTVITRNAGFQLAASDLAVKKGNIELELTGNIANIRTMTMQVNNQKVAFSGQISNPVAPNVHLRMTSPNLNLDRLLPQNKAAKPSSKLTKDKGGRIQKKTVPQEKVSKAELPPLVRKMTADLQVKADQGRYKGLQFKKLKMNLLYKRGVIESYDLNLGIDDGYIETKGSADLRDLDRITFAVDSDIKALQLGTVAPLFGIDKFPLSGPMSLKGQLQGRTGNTKELLVSLDGNLETEMGPGKLKQIGKAGEITAKILSVTSVKGILSGRLLDDLATKGLSYQTIKARTTFSKGNLELNNYKFVSDTANMDAAGSINLIDEQMDIKAELEPLGMVGKALGIVPVLGKGAQKLTKVHLHLRGPWDNPKVNVALGEGIVGAAKEEKKATGRVLKGITDFLKKEKNKLRKK
jgi:hypothetical protein